jgi:hypothetical protein
MDEFTPLEIQLIKCSLTVRTDEEIAELLERPVQDIRKLINDLTGMAGQRQQEIQERRLVQLQAKSVKRNIQRKKAEEHIDNQEKKEKIKPPEQTEQKQRNSEHRAQLKKQDSAMSRKYSTRQIDYTKLRSLRIDDRTTVFLEPGDDPEEVRKKYLAIRKQQSHGTYDIEG